MLTCCEEQDAQEQAALSKHRTAVRASEARLLRGQLLRDDAMRALRCGDGCMCCRPCEEEPEEEAGGVGAPAARRADGSDIAEEDEEEDEEDMADEALIRKMREARLAQMRGAAAEARAQGVGAYTRVTGPRLLECLGGAAPVVLHLSLQDSDASGAPRHSYPLHQPVFLLPSATTRLYLPFCDGGLLAPLPSATTLVNTTGVRNRRARPQLGPVTASPERPSTATYVHRRRNSPSSG